MTNILLISPPEQYFLMEAGDRPSLGLLYLAGALREAGHTAMISDLNHDSYYDLNNKIKQFNPQYIGMSTFTPFHNWTMNFIHHLKHNYPKIKYIAGGPHASADPESLKNDFDYIVIGEGEKAIVSIANGDKLEQIINMPLEKDLDNLPMPAWDIIPLEKYKIMQEGHRTASLLSSRSCPYSCFFCLKAVTGKKYRSHSVDRIIKEMDYLSDNYGFRSFYFVDDCFTINKDRVLEFAEKVKPKNYTFRLTSRTDTVDEEMLVALKGAGLRSISFGLEHMNDDVLKTIHKSNTAEHNLNTIRMAKKHDVSVRGSFILNLPKATKETMYQCLETAIKEDIDFADFYSLIAYPGTDLWNNPDRYGIEVINREYGIHQTSRKTNVDNKMLSLDDYYFILNDIHNKWWDFKGTKVPWELKK